MTRNRLLLLAAMVFTASGCSDLVQPGADLVAGAYTAQTFEWVDHSGTPNNLLQIPGSRVDLVLDRNGAFRADLLQIPVALLEDGQQSDFRVTGRWSYTDGELTLEGVPNSFLDTPTFSVRGTESLEDEFDVNGSVVRLRLVRQQG
jgi:hypothetical protein